METAVTAMVMRTEMMVESLVLDLGDIGICVAFFVLRGGN
jgi:hypothetical protein